MGWFRPLIAYKSHSPLAIIRDTCIYYKILIRNNYRRYYKAFWFCRRNIGDSTKPSGYARAVNGMVKHCVPDGGERGEGKRGKGKEDHRYFL